MLKKHVNLLGLTVNDKVTGFHGVVTSISFDLYGCVQAIVTPPISSEKRDGKWLDVCRLDVLQNDRALPVPEFNVPGPVAAGKKGPADKPVKD